MPSHSAATPPPKSDLLQKQEALFCMLARFGDALASPKRLKIIGLLSQGEKSVEQLAAMTQQSVAATSAHLKVLRASSLVVARKHGRHVWSALANENVTRLWLALRSLGEELLPEVREIIRDYFEHPETLAPLTMTEVLEEARNQRIILLDLRNADEFHAGHLPHARNLPFADLAAHLDELPTDQPILAYCRGPYCVTALEGIATLRESGRAARRLRFGVPEWQTAGLPLDVLTPS